ncbi:hypothetical protein TKK_0011272 [Trichogramma kaykai]|uniref:Anaphase-promoting complex subunit 4-like WD40 domain-containing protein n=1 Tax=Trichogramma kaykai TaxID=54128 RepID=A0ABD2WTB0_9HYME
MLPNSDVVVGYAVDDVINKYKMEHFLASHSHLANFECVPAMKHYAASSTVDDSIWLYDILSTIESGKLVNHNDTINSMDFSLDVSQLTLASNDVLDKISRQISCDGILRTWNFVKGRQAYATTLSLWEMDTLDINFCTWSPSEHTYLIVTNNKIDVYTLSTGMKENFVLDYEVECIKFLDEEFVAVGLENGKISILNLETGSVINEIRAYDDKVRCMAKLNNLLASVSSLGEIKLWSIEKDDLTYLNKLNFNTRKNYTKPMYNEISLMTLTSLLKQNDTVEKNISSVSRTSQRIMIEDEGNKSIVITKKSKTKKSRKLEDDDNNKENICKKRRTDNIKNFEKGQNKRNASVLEDDRIEENSKKKRKNEAYCSKQKNKNTRDSQLDFQERSKTSKVNKIDKSSRKHKLENVENESTCNKKKRKTLENPKKKNSTHKKRLKKIQTLKI